MSDKKKYIKIKRHDGGSYAQPMDKIDDALQGELDGLQLGETITITFEMIELSDEEYESLPEFVGH